MAKPLIIRWFVIAVAGIVATLALTNTAGEKPSSSPYPEAETDHLEGARTAVVDAAGVSGGLWLSYLFVLFYLLIATGGITHRDLFLENSTKLPFLNVELPFKGFSCLGPSLLLVVHSYVLLHFVLLSSKAGIFDAQLRAQIDDDVIRTELRRQLPINIFVQFLTGPREVRRGVVGFLLRLIAWISLVIGPLALLVFFELQFLPYHAEWITMWQRIVIAMDLGLVWLLWPAVLHGEVTRRPWQKIGWSTCAALASISLVLLIFTSGIATFSGEWLDTEFAWFPFRQALVSGRWDFITRKPTSLWANRLVVPGLNVTDSEKSGASATGMTVLERGRHLEGAMLNGAILRKVDFTGAQLINAFFEGAVMTDAIFVLADLSHADLEGANLAGADLRSANLFHVALDKVNLKGANLANAKLANAYLGETNLSEAKLTWAQLTDADLQDVTLTDANLTGADLRGARLYGANLSGANLTGTNLTNAKLSGANLTSANLGITILNGADLSGADLTDATILTQGQLDRACGSSPKALPRWFTWGEARPCP